MAHTNAAATISAQAQVVRRRWNQRRWGFAVSPIPTSIAELRRHWQSQWQPAPGISRRVATL
ncbi:MAG: hypothetical protein ABSG68_19665 [Thermoguttaceae bacterium]